MRLTLTSGAGRTQARGRFETYDAPDVSPDMSFLEMLDVVNEDLIAQGEEPIAFDHDCREGICGTCALMINGVAARPAQGHHDLPAPHAALQGRRHADRSSRGARGRFRWCATWSWTAARSTGSSRPAATSRVAPAARRTPTRSRSPRTIADAAMDAAACIGCGACVAACPNASAIAVHRGQGGAPRPAAAGQAERRGARLRWCAQMDAEGFGGCTNFGECQEACPKEISVETIALLNRDFLRATLTERSASRSEGAI